MKKKLLLLTIMLMMSSMINVQAQTDSVKNVQTQSDLEFHLHGDVVSGYLWRGLDLGHVSLQPEMSLSWKGLSLSAWGSVGLSDHKDNRELDLTLSYEIGGLSFGVIDYWTDSNNNRFFYYKNDNTGHSFEGFVSYDFGPLSASWQTFFAGSDFQEDSGKRAFSSYFEVAAPFRFATCDWDAAIGFVPWKSDCYSTNGFRLINLSLQATKEIKISRTFSLPVFGQLVANPNEQTLYFIFGFTLNVL